MKHGTQYLLRKCVINVKSVNFYKFALISLFLTSCATFDGDLTKFEPLRSEQSSVIYKFSTSANAIYPLDSDKAEQIRIGWLEAWIKKNGLDEKNYQILSKKVVPARTGALGKNYYLYYEVRTHEKPQQ